MPGSSVGNFGGASSSGSNSSANVRRGSGSKVDVEESDDIIVGHCAIGALDDSMRVYSFLTFNR